jgi:hypothetical protein
VTDARFTVASRWIDISGLTSVASGLDYTALKRVCYLFVPIDRAKVGTSRVRRTYCRHCGPCFASGSARFFLAAR